MKRKQRQKRTKRQVQKYKRRKRSLHDKHKRRRKKDMMIGMPFIIGYQGDPAMGVAYMYCDQVRTYKLINAGWFKPFARLQRYLAKPILTMFAIQGKILVKEAF